MKHFTYAATSLLLVAAFGFKTPRSSPDLSVWRKPDAKGRSCSHCHSPDGIELAAYKFDASNILRRTVPHLGVTEAPALARMISGLDSTIKPLGDRPFQPGGAVLPGKTPRERDGAFLLELEKSVPFLTTGRVASEADAIRARDELRAVDLAKLRVGIEFNRLSEDGFHGTAHRTVASWFPDVPPPRKPGSEPVLQAAQDAYLADPTDDALRTLDKVTSENTVIGKSPAEDIAALKYRSLLILQHHLRTGRLVPLALQGQHGDRQNPFWDIGEFGRFTMEETNIEILGLPEDIRDKKVGGPSFAEQTKALRLPWFWLGWILDPGLQLSGSRRETRRGDYFSKFLFLDGPYPGHAAFMVSKRMVEQAYNPKAWNYEMDKHFTLQYSFFLMNDNAKLLEPKDPQDRARFRRFTANTLRMGLYLLAKDIRETRVAVIPESQLFQVGMIEQTLQRIDPQPGDRSLTAQVRSLISSARPLR